MIMKKQILALLFLFTAAMAFGQTLTITPTYVESSTSTTRNNFYCLDDVYFIYNTSTGGFEARDADTRQVLYAANISTVTITGTSTAAEKLAYLEYTHVKCVTTGGVYNSFIPKSEVDYLYKASDKKIELRSGPDQVPLWYGHVDSVKTSSSASNTSLRLADLRKFRDLGQPTLKAQVGSTGTATIAAGAGAGSSPTIAISGGGLTGEITLTSGSSPTTTGVIATITLPVTFPTGCRVLLFPSNDNAAAHIARVYATGTTTTAVITASGTALGGATAYKWSYIIVGY